MKIAAANRGKKEEKQAEEYLREKAAKDKFFVFHRYPDSHSAQGALSPQPADYEYLHHGQHGLLEVKGLQHAFRLPRKRIEGQIGRMRLWEIAGSRTYFLICHFGKTWRCVPASFFFDKLDDTSFDLREFPEHETVDAAFLELLK